jgi:hypothetical protein
MTPDTTPAWMNPRIELLDSGTDWDTADVYVLRPLLGFALRVTLKHAQPDLPLVFDGRLVNTQCILSHSVAGVLVQRTNEYGHTDGTAPVFIPYENLDALGIY